MKVPGSQARGITIPGFRHFIENGGFFKVERVKGRAFYFAPGKLGQSPANLMSIRKINANVGCFAQIGRATSHIICE